MFSAFGQPTQSSSPFANPFATATSSTATPTANPFAASSEGAKTSRQASPFATTSDSETNKAPAPNPFANAFAKPGAGNGSTFGHGNHQPKEPKVNPFAQNNAPSKPAPSFGGPPGGGNGGGAFASTDGLRPPTGPKASSRHLNAQEPAQSNDPHAKRVYEQLRKDRISPPAWPSQPGSPAKKAEMAKFREQYEAYRKKVRASLTKAGLIDDPDKRKTLENAIEFKGICEDMCPQYEQITRINEFDVVGAEKDAESAWAIPSMMVKKLARSAAGQEAPLPMDVRSVASLRRTFDYLIDDLLREDSNLPNVHGFLWDRTRAIRRDFTFFSSLTPDELRTQVYVLENIARFHITSLHLLSQEGVKPEDFVEQQEAEQLGKALLSLRDVYDDCGEQGIVCENEPEFRAYYLVYHAKDPNIIETLQRQWKPSLWKDSDVVRTAVSLVEAMQSTHDLHGPSLGLNKEGPSMAAAAQYLAYFRIVEDPKTSYTMACFAEYNFPHIRRSILSAVKKALSRPKDTARDVTAAVLNRFLRFDTIQQAIDFAELHNLEWTPDSEHPSDISRQCLVLNNRQPMSHPRLYHQFSSSLVEKKRGSHTLPTIIHTSVFEAANAAKSAPPGPAAEESLFVPDKPQATASPLQETPSESVRASASIWGKTQDEKPVSAFQGFGPSPAANPFASSLKPSSGVAPTKSPTIATAPTPPITTISQQPKIPSLDGTQESKSFGAKELDNGNTTATPSDSAFTKPSPFSTTPAPSEPPKAPETKPSFFGASQQAQETPKFQFGPSTQTSEPTSSKPGTPSPFSQGATSQKALPESKSQPPFEPTSGSTTSAASSTPKVSFEAPKSAQTAPSAPSSLFGPDSVSQATRPGTALSAPPSDPTPPPRDPMVGFTEWYLHGDEGLFSEFKAYIVEELLTGLYDDFQTEQEERLRQEEQDRLNAEADALRRYNLSLRYFYHWKNTAREMRLRSVRRKAREEARAFYEQQRAAEKHARREAAAQAARKEAQMAGLNRPEELMQMLKTRRVGRREAEKALLASGVLSGAANEREAVSHIVQREISPSVDGSLDERRSIRSGSGSVASSTNRGGSKTRALRDQLLRGGSTGFRRSLPSMTGSTRSSAEPESSRRSRVSERWRLKAMGIVQMPDGTAVPENLADEMMNRGWQYAGPGSSMAGRYDETPSRRASFGSSTRLQDSIAMPPPPRAPSACPAMVDGSTSPTKRKRTEGEEDDSILPEGKEPRASNHKRIMSGAEKVISELRALRMEMEEGKDWFREQSDLLRSETGQSRGSTPWGGSEG